MIVLTDELALGSDQYQWILYKPRKISKSNPSGWQSFKYYKNLDEAVRGAKSYLIRTSHYTTAQELLSLSLEISRSLDTKLREVLL